MTAKDTMSATMNATIQSRMMSTDKSASMVTMKALVPEQNVAPRVQSKWVLVMMPDYSLRLLQSLIVQLLFPLPFLVFQCQQSIPPLLADPLDVIRILLPLHRRGLHELADGFQGRDGNL